MRSFAGLLVVLLVAHACAQSTNLSSINTFGIDMIMLDSPAWCTKIQKSHVNNEIFVVGETMVRGVVGSATGTPFTAVAITPDWLGQPYEMIDAEVVGYNNLTWTIGVTDFTIDAQLQFSSFAPYFGPYLPLFYVKPNGGSKMQTPVDSSTNINWIGTMFSAVRVDTRNASDVQVFFAGFEAHTDPDLGLVSTFGVYRTHFNMALYTGAPIQPNIPFVYDDATEAASLYNPASPWFSTFSATWKPIIHLLPDWGFENLTLAIVADPNSRAVYWGSFDQSVANFTTGGWLPLGSQPINLPGSDLVSAVLSKQNQKLYVGLALSGANATGYIAAIDLFAVASTLYQLPPNANNPKALALDDKTGLLYIGLNGNSEVLRFDTNSGNVTGYQRLPEWLHRSWDATEFPDHIYFVTNEEHSKVFRVNKGDFCPARCPYNGYCSNGKCACGQGYTMVNSNCELTQLVHEQTIYKKVHGGEVALGILFMFAVIAAAAGWFMWFKGRRAAYQAV